MEITVIKSQNAGNYNEKEWGQRMNHAPATNTGAFFVECAAKIPAKNRKKYRNFFKKGVDKSKRLCYYIQALSEATVEWDDDSGV
jgi:hypothetical protein